MAQIWVGGEVASADGLRFVVRTVLAVGLWNTYYLDVALNHLRAEEKTVMPDDVARLSPLAHDHINMLGRYHFYLPESLKNGGMRPLRSDKGATKA